MISNLYTIKESGVADILSNEAGTRKHVLAAETVEESQLLAAAEGNQLGDVASVDESQLRDAAPMIFSQDVIDSSIVASSAVKRTFSTDSDRSDIR